ncbi:hypothetical protein Acr_14g0007180 [Actinidia rufa]|uniref:CCHC-type domain-containing protein n=1 Tax=Actinidia rufa TaxID=165716 RepID=A0A7J0FQT4_9ERIC|nr:hypothetical protein Acr_14g0007180 [Actinidia rufa]
MHFILTTLKVVYVLTTQSPEEKDDETLVQAQDMIKWENDDYICRGHILNALSDALFDVYQNSEMAKELWDALHAKYLIDDATSKKFLNCGKPGHIKRDCRALKRQKIGGKPGASEANNSKFVAVISEINVLKDDGDWWINSGAMRHVGNDKKFFTDYDSVEDGTFLYMENSSTAPMKRKGKVDLEFTSGKTLMLTDVYHVPDVRKNLEFGSLLNKHGFKEDNEPIQVSNEDNEPMEHVELRSKRARKEKTFRSDFVVYLVEDEMDSILGNEYMGSSCYSGYPPVLEGYTDASWTTERNDHFSTSG